MFPIQAPVGRGGEKRVIGWRMKKPSEEAFHRMLREWSWSLTKAECLDLPEQTDVYRVVELDAMERTAYDTMMETARLELADGRLTRASGAPVMKLRQITQGQCRVGDEVETLGRSKLDQVEAILDEIGTRPVVLWAEFTHEIDRLVGLCEERGEVVRYIDGRVDAGIRQQYIEGFQAGAITRLVCHPAAAGHGITLTASSHAIYYSHGFSYEQYRQSRDRIHRNGQRNVCTYYHLIADDTVDVAVMKCLGRKGDAHEAIMSALKTDRNKWGAKDSAA